MTRVMHYNCIETAKVSCYGICLWYSRTPIQGDCSVSSKNAGILEFASISGPYLTILNKNGQQQKCWYIGVCRYFWTPVN